MTSAATHYHNNHVIIISMLKPENIVEKYWLFCSEHVSCVKMSAKINSKPCLYTLSYFWFQILISEWKRYMQKFTSVNQSFTIQNAKVLVFDFIIHSKPIKINALTLKPFGTCHSKRNRKIMHFKCSFTLFINIIQLYRACYAK